MRKYDVTGVGLNLAPAEEYERKVGAPLPSGSPAEVRRHQLSAAVSPRPLLRFETTA